LLATFVTMMLGIFSMGAGGSLDRRVSTPLMWGRVILQGLAVALLLLALYLH
jgi:hypothetical protein